MDGNQKEEEEKDVNADFTFRVTGESRYIKLRFDCTKLTSSLKLLKLSIRSQ